MQEPRAVRIDEHMGSPGGQPAAGHAEGAADHVDAARVADATRRDEVARRQTRYAVPCGMGASRMRWQVSRDVV